MSITSAATVQSVANSPLFKLPAELRLRIYEYAVHADANRSNCFSEGECEISRHGGIPEPTLLVACKTIREEAIQVFYSKNKFYLNVQDHHPATVVLKMRKQTALRLQYNCSITWGSHLLCGRPHWRNLLLWLRYHHAGEAEAPTSLDFNDNFNGLCKGLGTYPIIESMFKVAHAMRYSPWAEVKAILWHHHVALTRQQSGWKNYV